MSSSSGPTHQLAKELLSLLGRPVQDALQLGSCLSRQDGESLTDVRVLVERFTQPESPPNKRLALLTGLVHAPAVRLTWVIEPSPRLGGDA